MAKISRAHLVFAAALLVSIVIPCMAQETLQQQNGSSTTNQTDREQAKAEVDAIVARILAESTSVKDGITMTTWIPPSVEDRSEITQLGDRAILPLSAYLDSAAPLTQLLAVRLLGAIGGSKTIAPLESALDQRKWVTVRTQALSSLMNAPSSEVIPIVQNVLKTDPDPAVQRRAKQVLMSLGGEVAP